MRKIRQLAIGYWQLAIGNCRRFCGDESGQGIIFAAATLLVLIGFVAYVFNIGRLLDRRTKTQIAADAAVYSGAMVEANAISSIAWINSAMSQVYYNAMNYAKDVDETAVAAELERQTQTNASGPGHVGGAAWQAYQTAYSQAQTALPQAKKWMLQLSQLENAIAIVAPRLAEEEMFVVAARAGGERVEAFPSFRLFPYNGSTISYSIQRLPNGWTITNITAGGNGQSLTFFLDGQGWHLQYSNDGIITQEVLIAQNNPSNWDIKFYQPPGSLKQEVNIVNDPILGWVVSGTTPNPGGGPPVPMQPISFTPVDMNGSGYNEGVRITQGGFSQVLMRGADGNTYLWNGSSYIPMTSSQTTVGGVNVQVNVTNTIKFPGGSAQIGQPTTVNVGGARLVLTNPPNVSCGMGPVRISVNGFSPTSFNVSCGGFSLTPGVSDGRWRDHYNPSEEAWWRNRLIVMGNDAAGAPNLWQYDYETLGALLRYESNGYIAKHAFMANGGTGDPSTWPAWAGTANGAVPWFNTDPGQAAPANPAWRPQDSDFGPVDPTYNIRHLLPANQGSGPGSTYPPPGAYYQTSPLNSPLGCPACSGTGRLNGIPGNPPCSCPWCHGWDNSPLGNSHYSNIRVSVAMLAQSPLYPNGVLHDAASLTAGANFFTAPMFINTANTSGYSINGAPIGTPTRPLVATEDFFKWGLNIGVWKHAFNGNLSPKDTPMLFPSSREPAWGTVAVASARVGLPNGNGTCVWQFTDKGARSNWVQSSLQNLYYADVQAQLFASKYQVNDFDLDTDIIQGAPVAAIDQSGLAYLWSAILQPYGYYENRNDWMTRFNGQADPRIGQLLQNMQNRQGATFDYGSGELNQVVQH